MAKFFLKASAASMFVALTSIMVSCGGSSNTESEKSDEKTSTVQKQDSNSDYNYSNTGNSSYSSYNEDEEASYSYNNEADENNGTDTESNNSSAKDEYDPYAKVLSEYGVEYTCVHDPRDNDEFLKNFDNDKVMSNMDDIITAWEIYEEESLRYMMAPGTGGMDCPAAFSRNQKFKDLNGGGYGVSNDTPVGYMENHKWGYEQSSDFTDAQKARITKFLENYEKAQKEWYKKHQENGGY